LRSEFYQTLINILTTVQEEPFGIVVEDFMSTVNVFFVKIHSDLFAQVGPAIFNLIPSASGD
jgi:hypothetical protein